MTETLAANADRPLILPINSLNPGEERMTFDEENPETGRKGIENEPRDSFLDISIVQVHLFPRLRRLRMLERMVGLQDRQSNYRHAGTKDRERNQGFFFLSV